MAKIKIDVYEQGSPSATITIPLWVVTGASKILPKLAGKGLQDRIDIDQLVELAKDPQAKGILLDIEEHKDKQRIVISVVGEDDVTASAVSRRG